MPGIASRKLNRAAPERESPSARPAVMVMPDRDVPGISASACAQPIASACGQVSENSSFRPRPKRSARYISIPKKLSVPATKSGLRKFASMKSPNARPTRPTGMVATRICHARRLSAVWRRRNTESSQATAIVTSCRRKYSSNATSVPTCTATSKASPWSGQPKTWGIRIRWPELEIGRNSERPCTMARTMAWTGSMDTYSVCLRSRTAKPRRGES